MSGVTGSGVDLYARARLRFPIVVTGTNTLVNGSGLPSGFISMTNFTSFIFESNGANTGAVTLDIGDGVARAVVGINQRALVAGDIQAANTIVECVYDETNNVFYAMLDESVGRGQTWQNVTGSRALNVTYTNTTGKSIGVNIMTQTNSGKHYLNSNGVQIGWQSEDYPSYSSASTISAIIPAGGTYILTKTGSGNIDTWAELR